MESEFWTIWKAVERYPASLNDPTVRDVMTGESCRPPGAALTISDLTNWLIPGLAALGIQAELHELDKLALPEDTSSLPAPLFAFSEEISPSSPGTDADETTDCSDNGPEPIVIRQGLLVQMDLPKRDSVEWRESPDVAVAGAWRELVARYTHIIRLRRYERKGKRRLYLQAAWLRWLAYAEAYPDSIPRCVDIVRWNRIAAFLNSIAGGRRDRVSNRLRKAAGAYASGDVPRALVFLKLAAMVVYALPAALESAIVSDPADRSLSGIERRDLIYLARAGIRDLKVLAARRLTYEMAHVDVQATLEQVRCDPDAWVRAAGCQHSRIRLN